MIALSLVIILLLALIAKQDQTIRGLRGDWCKCVGKEGSNRHCPWHGEEPL